MTTTILAIDLGKYKSVACTYARDTAAAEFRTVTTSRAELDRLVRTARPAVVVIEACTPAGWVHDLCAELGVPCKVAHTGARRGSTSTRSGRRTGTTRGGSPSWRPSTNSRRWWSQRSGCGSGGP